MRRGGIEGEGRGQVIGAHDNLFSYIVTDHLRLDNVLINTLLRYSGPLIHGILPWRL